MTPDQYCQERASASGSSFYYSFLFLPPPRRRAITALYAYCREVDDAVDETTDSAVAGAKLDWWRTEIDRLFAGAPQHPVTRALQPHLEDYGITRERLLQVLEGMRMDLVQNRFLDFPALARYCHLVAGVQAVKMGNDHPSRIALPKLWRYLAMISPIYSPFRKVGAT